MVWVKFPNKQRHETNYIDTINVPPESAACGKLLLVIKLCRLFFCVRSAVTSFFIVHVEKMKCFLFRNVFFLNLNELGDALDISNSLQVCIEKCPDENLKEYV